MTNGKKYPLQIFSNRDEDPDLLKSIENAMKQRRGYVFNKPINENVILLASGGLDSTVTVDLIIREWNVKVYPLFVRRSARATVFEEKAFDFFVDFYKKRFPDNFMAPFKVEIEVPPIAFKKYKMTNRLSKLGHPMRNFTLQNIATQYLAYLEGTKGVNVNTIFTSTVGDDTFPHSSLLSLRIENLAICVDSGNWHMQLTSPLIDTEIGNRPLFKKDLILYAKKRKIPLEYTRTCINGNEIPDGNCNECRERLSAFMKAGIKDPVQYKK
jgi:7-cyano-7-deazaguanine synthase in queuosine biosynthesis